MEEEYHHYRHVKWGIFLILVAWLFLTLSIACSRMVTKTVPVLTVLFFQNIIALISISPWLYAHGMQSLKTKRPGLILFRALIGTTGFALLFLAVKYTSLVDAMVLNNTGPLFLPFVLLIWLKKPINHKLWAGIIIGFIGVICILKPSSEVMNLGAIYGLITGLCLAILMVTARLLSHTEKPHAVNFYYFLIASLCTLPFTIYLWRSLTANEWLILLFLGIFFAFGQMAWLKAFQYAKASVLSPFTYVAIIYSTFLEWILWKNIPDLFAWLGILLIIAGGLWNLKYSTAVGKKAM